MQIYDIDDEALFEAREELNGGAENASSLFEFACLVSNIPLNKGRLIVRENDEIALFRLGGEIYAISNICPHEISPVLASGVVDRAAHTVVCPLHGWTFDIATGKLIETPAGKIDGGSGGVPIYNVKIEGDEVWVSERSVL